MKKLLIPLLVTALLAGCASPAPDEGPARQALLGFFDALQRGDYAAADATYGGSYQTLTDWNPELDPADHAALWQAACTRNGLQCLTVRSAELQSRDGDEFIFIVTFNAPDGGLFILGPCCGADETQMPPVSEFQITVARADGQFKVMDLPPYVP